MNALHGFKAVSREEFRSFLSNYPGTLEHDCVTIAEPPLHNYCDWSKSDSSLGTAEAHERAIQAYCTYDDSQSDGGRFFVRVELAVRA